MIVGLRRFVFYWFSVRDKTLRDARWLKREVSRMYPRDLPVYGFPIIVQTWAVWGTHAWEGP